MNRLWQGAVLLVVLQSLACETTNADRASVPGDMHWPGLRELAREGATNPR